MLLETRLGLHCLPEWRAVTEYLKRWILAHPAPVPCSSRKVAKAPACIGVLCSMGTPCKAPALRQLQ